MHARLATERWEAALPSGPAQVKNSPPKNFCKYIPGARLRDSARLTGSLLSVLLDFGQIQLLKLTDIGCFESDSSLTTCRPINYNFTL